MVGGLSLPHPNNVLCFYLINDGDPPPEVLLNGGSRVYCRFNKKKKKG